MLDNESTRNLIIATVLSFVIIVAWQLFVISPQEESRQQQLLEEQTAKSTGVDDHLPSIQADNKNIASKDVSKIELALTPRQRLSSKSLSGSISLRGTRFDDLRLKSYKQSLLPSSSDVRLLDRVDSQNPFFAEFGFIGSNLAEQQITAPTGTSLWQSQTRQTELSPLDDAIFTYESGGVTFRRTISLDENYLFTILDEVINMSPAAVSFYPYARVSRSNVPEVSGFFILHEGLIGVIGDNGLQEIDYDDLLDEKKISFSQNTGGFIGITDKYWAAILIPEQDKSYNAEYSYYKSGSADYFQADYLMQKLDIRAGETASIRHQLFAGAKVVNIIDGYQDKLKVANFDLLIDWGWFYFITKPLFKVLQFFTVLTGNFGLSILTVTVLLKILFFPLANKSYVSMSRMKKFQPEISEISKRYKDDRAEAQKHMMSLYKKHKINPMSGCLPVLLQIPVFFALYKVLFVTIEMRHAPFFGWIQDLSAPDQTSLFNLFGLLPFGVPEFMVIGVWPILMGISMFVQMRLNPSPPDPIQAKVFAFMPLFFTFLLARFPAGLVIYWTWNNLLSILQQWFIMRRQGVAIDIIGNTLELFGKKQSSSPDKADKK